MCFLAERTDKDPERQEKIAKYILDGSSFGSK